MNGSFRVFIFITFCFHGAYKSKSRSRDHAPVSRHAPYPATRAVLKGVNKHEAGAGAGGEGVLNLKGGREA